MKKRIHEKNKAGKTVNAGKVLWSLDHAFKQGYDKDAKSFYQILEDMNNPCIDKALKRYKSIF